MFRNRLLRSIKCCPRWVQSSHIFANRISINSTFLNVLILPIIMKILALCVTNIHTKYSFWILCGSYFVFVSAGGWNRGVCFSDYACPCLMTYLHVWAVCSYYKISCILIIETMFHDSSLLRPWFVWLTLQSKHQAFSTYGPAKIFIPPFLTSSRNGREYSDLLSEVVLPQTISISTMVEGWTSEPYLAVTNSNPCHNIVLQHLIARHLQGNVTDHRLTCNTVLKLHIKFANFCKKFFKKPSASCFGQYDHHEVLKFLLSGNFCSFGLISCAVPYVCWNIHQWWARCLYVAVSKTVFRTTRTLTLNAGHINRNIYWIQ
jgi:hypothetical protein